MIETWPFLAVLASAILHASWNASVRASTEPGGVLAAGVMLAGVVGLAGLAWSGLPQAASWRWLIIGVIVNSIGIRLAMAAYRSASFGLAYPVMRAGIPLFTLPTGVIFLGEWPRWAGVVGVLLIAAALIMLALAARGAGKAETRGLAYALAASLMGAGYVTADAVGVRVSGNFLGYFFGVILGNAIALQGLMALEGKSAFRQVRSHFAAAATIAVISTASFLLYLWAVTLSPVALAAALRETSVLFAVAIARFALKEEIGRWHWLAASCAVTGIAAIRLG
jgi:drug/metabolite transporter (DMT)-like permease